MLQCPQSAGNGRQLALVPLQQLPLETHAPPLSRQESTAIKPRTDQPSHALSASKTAIKMFRFTGKMKNAANVRNGWKADVQGSTSCARSAACLNRIANFGEGTVCGIAGYLDVGGMSGAANNVHPMINAIANRGPDDEGIWIDADARIALGHRRLAIIDTSSGGHQPMSSPSGRFVIVFNGEIYNFAEIRSELEAANKSLICWRGGSDTEVLLAAIERWGVVRTLERLNGMFAFAVWDRDNRTLTLARDRMGEKPLYYGSVGGAFLFGSELKALRAHPSFSGTLNREAVATMLRYDYVPSPGSIWLGISKLQPGHYIEVSDAGRKIGSPTCYWSLQRVARLGQELPLPDAPETVGELAKLLSNAVRLRMMADVPLGAFLSGGIDSSLIVALMQAQAPRPVRTFTVGFQDPRFDEAPHARAIAQHLGTDHTDLYVSPADALELIPDLPRIWDEPLGDSSQVPTYLVSALARKEVTVALSGDGGDELFGGYGRYRSTLKAWKQARQGPKALRRLFELAARLQNDVVPGSAARFVQQRSAQSVVSLYDKRVSRLQSGDQLVLGASGLSKFEHVDVDFLETPVAKMMYMDTLDYLPDDVLTKVDRASMAVSLEVRPPFLDHRIVEFSWALPQVQKLHGGVGKKVLRSLLGEHLPSFHLERSKKGFAVPVAAWMRGPLRSWAEDLLDEDRLKRDSVLNAPAVRAIWRDFLSGKPRHHRVMWNILMFQAWWSESTAT